MMKKTIDGHEMVYYHVNTVAGSVYASDYDTDYNQHLFVFYEELGYIVEFGGMQKLGAQGMFALAKKAKLALEFLKQKKGKYYTSVDCSYDNAKRPEEIEYAFVDSMPCYFEETKGSKSFWMIDDMKAGEERTLHFAYLVDEDMIDNGYLIDMEGLQQNDDSDKDLNSDLQYIQLDSK